MNAVILSHTSYPLRMASTKRVYPLTRGNLEGRRAAAAITIGRNVFVGAQCIVLKGVTIGDGATIGAGSVVTKDVPRGETWAGRPARRIGLIVESPSEQGKRKT